MANHFRIAKFSLGLLLILSLALAAMIMFSPYGKVAGFEYKLIKNSIVINVDADSAFHYLGNSANASEWSAIVDHITPLNDGSFEDGTVGSRRRCFYNADESGRKWDELITEVIPGQKRQLSIYNMQDFPLIVDNLATEQLYEQIAKDKCKITFTLFLQTEPNLAENLKTYFAAYKIHNVFEENVDNIKKILEGDI